MTHELPNKLDIEFLENEIADVAYHRLGKTLTICVITNKDGFTFTGESACIDPANFDEKIGQEVAYANAVDKMWMPYGFWLVKESAKNKNEPSEVYELKDTDMFGIDLAVALVESGDTVKSVTTGTVLTPEDVNGVWQVVGK